MGKIRELKKIALLLFSTSSDPPVAGLSFEMRIELPCNSCQNLCFTGYCLLEKERPSRNIMACFFIGKKCRSLHSQIDNFQAV
jgi:hypothetical protein